MTTPQPCVKFLLCDDARPEASGKLTLIGLYPDDKIIVQSNLAQAALPANIAAISQLAIVAIIFDGSGSFPMRASIVGPKGHAVTTMPLGSPSLNAHAPSIVILQGGSFPVAEYGRYTCTLSIGKTDFPFHFEILAGLLPVLSLPATPKRTRARRKTSK